jgi:two-component system sensor kinase FixL
LFDQFDYGGKVDGDPEAVGAFYLKNRDEMQTHLRSILESVPDAMIVIDQRGTVMAFSNAAVDMFGYMPEDIIGQNVSVLMTQRDAASHDTYMTNYQTTGRAQIIGVGRMVMAKRSDGTEFPVDLKIGKAEIDGKHVYTGFIRDLSEQQRSELRIREMQAELVHFSRLSSVGTMASALAHELNQPLTAIANYLEAGRDILDDPSEASVSMVKEALDEAAKQSVRAGQIVRKLRDYVSRGEIAARPVALGPLLRDAIALAQIGTTDHTAAISIDVSADEGLVNADPIQVQQVVINLVRNAFEALDGQRDGAVNIRLLAPTNTMAIVEIIDNGPGIDPDIASQLFRPFTTSKSSGMGLGLSICQTIVEAHGGTIEAEPGGDSGTVFRFSLPRTETD